MSLYDRSTQALLYGCLLTGGAIFAPLSIAQQTIEEVVVTAEKREESLQDVSLSVTAFNEELLRLGGIDDVSRLEFLVPGLNYAFAGNDAKFNVRGANSTNTFGDNSSIVGAFVDGVYQARASQQTRAFFDVSSVEFLRGPQGTLYGRNTFAGALNVYTNRPDTEEFSGKVGLSHQSFDRNRMDVAVNLPLSGVLAIRLAGFFDNSDGFIKNDAGPDVGAQDDFGYRVSVLYQPVEQLEILARYTNVRESGNEAGLFGHTFNCRNETTNGLTDPFGEVRNCENPVRGSGARGVASNGPNGDPWRISQDYVRPVELEDETTSLQVAYNAESVSLKYIGSINRYTNDINFDFDFSPTPNSNGGYLEASKGSSHEFQVSSANEARVQWTAGVYYSQLEDRSSFYIYQQTVRDDSTREEIVDPNDPMEMITLLQGTDILPGAPTNINGFFADSAVIETDYFGLYAQGEFSILDNLRIIAGLRYNEEKKALSCGGSNFTGDLNENGTTDRVVNVAEGVAGSSPLTLPENAMDVFTYNCNASDVVTTVGGDASYDNITWRAGVEFDLTEDVMLYVSGSSGYLSGAVSTSSTTDEQKSQVIELGFRSILLNQTLQFNGALHITKYTNLLTQRQREEGGIAVTFSDNGGDIEAVGIELDAILLLGKWTLSGNLAYLKSEFGTYGQSNPYQLYQGELRPFIDQNGETTPWSPEITLTASVAYRFDLGVRGSLTPYIQHYHSGGYNTSNLLATDPSHDQGAYSKTDFRLIWESVDYKYSVELFAENLQDNAVLARGNNNSDDIVQTSYLYPRNFGVKFDINF